MPNEPELHKPTLWVSFRSAIQWFVGGIYFVMGVAIIALLSLFVRPYKLDPFLRVWIGGIVLITGVRLTAHGLAKLDPKKPYLFIFNHISMFDHFFVYYLLKRTLRGVEKESHFRWPVYGYFLRKVGEVSIPPHGDTQRALQSLERLRELFDQGISVAILPEGTRSPNGKLQPFKRGAFRFALQTKATIAPMVLVGQYAFNRKGDWRLYPGPVDIYVEEPIETKGLTEEDLTSLRERVYKVIHSKLTQYEPQ